MIFLFKNEHSVLSNCWIILHGFNDVSALISVLPLLTKSMSKIKSFLLSQDRNKKKTLLSPIAYAHDVVLKFKSQIRLVKTSPVSQATIRTVESLHKRVARIG
jgi:hypothetical protein